MEARVRRRPRRPGGGGVRSYRVLRSTEDPNQVAIDLEFDSVAEAEAFQNSLRALWERVGGNLGLESRRMRIVEVVESKTN